MAKQRKGKTQEIEGRGVWNTGIRNKGIAKYMNDKDRY